MSFFKHKSDPHTTYGIYHQIDASISNYIMYLVESKDGLDHWHDVRKIDLFASQGKAWLNPNGEDIVIAYEQSNATWGGNSVRLLHYKNLAELREGHPAEQLDLPKSLVKECCEGTPSFEGFERWNGDLKSSKFFMRFHYLSKDRYDHD